MGQFLDFFGRKTRVDFDLGLKLAKTLPLVSQALQVVLCEDALTSIHDSQLPHFPISRTVI
jgi:hypothetical protein